MPQNTCKIVIKDDNTTTVSKGVFSTSDVELHILMLTYQTLKIPKKERVEL